MSAAGGVGFHGKLPVRGDFLTANLPRSFVDPWDAWLQAGIAASQAQLGERWLSIYLESPIWRFVLSPGACGPQAWAGVLMPSVDKVGRYFPLTIATELPDGPSVLETVTTATTWFERAEAIAMQALDDDGLDLDAFGRDVAALAEIVPSGPRPSDGDAAPGVWSVPLDADASTGVALSTALDRFVVGSLEAYSVWWSAGGGSVRGQLWLAGRLPAADRFARFLITDP